MPTLTDLSTIRDLCARYDFALSKGFGQNFIINPGICPVSYTHLTLPTNSLV